MSVCFAVLGMLIQFAINKPASDEEEQDLDEEESGYDQERNPDRVPNRNPNRNQRRGQNPNQREYRSEDGSRAEYSEKVRNRDR